MAPAQDDPQLRRELEDLRRRVEELEGKRAAEKDAGEAPEPELSPFWKRESLEQPAPLRGVYDKPFLASLWRRAFLGGYTELEYHSFEDGTLGIAEGFRMRRTNLFLYADVFDRVSFGSEIEFETEFEDPPSSGIEVAVEMAFVDWKLFEEFKVRGGAILVPLGRVNVNHDGPVRELTDRPLVSTFVIPTTLTEAGIGAYGSIALGSSLSLSYEAYAVNGFALLDESGALAVDVTEKEQLLREGRQSLGGDVNGGVASTGRVAVQLLGRMELGASWHAGTYDEKGDNFLAILAGDGAFVRDVGPVKLGLEGEVAVADFARDATARTAGVPDRFWGFYVQGSIGGMPAFLRENLPAAFGDEGAIFQAVFRWDWVDLDGDEGEALEPGITFRPVPDTIFKLSYRLSQKSIGLRGVPGRSHFDDEGIIFSLSSYF